MEAPQTATVTLLWPGEGEGLSLVKHRGQPVWGTDHSWGRCQPQSIVSSSGLWNTDKNNWIREKKKKRKKSWPRLKAATDLRTGEENLRGAAKWTIQGEHLGVHLLSPKWTDLGE